jgi:V8-like Glu-specific endopeptidase
LDTKTGHSGGPIMDLSDDETPTIIGVHTHKGNIRNFGVFLNEKVIKKLIKY